MREMFNINVQNKQVVKLNSFGFEIGFKYLEKVLHIKGETYLIIIETCTNTVTLDILNLKGKRIHRENIL